MLLVVTVICRMVQITKRALLSGEFPPLCPFRLWKCCRKDLPHSLLDGSLYETDAALPAPCAWSLVRLSTWELAGAEAQMSTYIKVCLSLEKLPLHEVSCGFWDPRSTPNMMEGLCSWDNEVHNACLVSEPSRSHKARISSLCSPRSPTTYDY